VLSGVLRTASALANRFKAVLLGYDYDPADYSCDVTALMWSDVTDPHIEDRLSSEIVVMLCVDPSYAPDPGRSCSTIEVCSR